MSQELRAEQRSASRKELSALVSVFDSMSGDRIGHIGNISSSGMMVICQTEVGESHLYQLGFSLPPVGDAPERQFNVGAMCLWCSEAESTGTYWAGFEVIDIADDDAQALEGIVVTL
ncbi:MAG: PilZ domain-containing protein [Lysobacterales bacterium]